MIESADVAARRQLVSAAETKSSPDENDALQRISERSKEAAEDTKDPQTEPRQTVYRTKSQVRTSQ